jgi:hypothetical protein
LNKGTQMKINSQPATLNPPTKIESENEVKMGLRDRYLLERDRIKDEIGDLELIRAKLGLSQRRLCQILLVDPSAWTRWLKTEAPPHIYKALSWLIELKKSQPEITGPSDVLARLDNLQATAQEKIAALEQQVALVKEAVYFKNKVRDNEPRVLKSDDAVRTSPNSNINSTQLQAEIQKLTLVFQSLLEQKTKNGEDSAPQPKKLANSKPDLSKSKAKLSKSGASLSKTKPGRRRKLQSKSRHKSKDKSLTSIANGARRTQQNKKFKSAHRKTQKPVQRKPSVKQKSPAQKMKSKVRKKQNGARR